MSFLKKNRLKEVAIEMQASQLKTSEVTGQAEKTLNELPVLLVSSQLNIILIYGSNGIHDEGWKNLDLG